MNEKQTWEVVVNVDGEHVLTLGTSELCGLPDLEPYADAIRTAAEHLLSFIGQARGDVPAGGDDSEIPF